MKTISFINKNGTLHFEDDVYSEDGLTYFYEGRPRKTKQSHPYSYDPFTIFKIEGECTGSVYTDRLYQWDYKKHNALCQKHFGNEGQYWDNREPEVIQAFLRDYLNKPALVLIKIIEYCNISNGYPVWRLDYAEGV